jgi:hypothetical protein
MSVAANVCQFGYDHLASEMIKLDSRIDDVICIDAVNGCVEQLGSLDHAFVII